MNQTNAISKSDLDRIEASLEKVLKATKSGRVDQEYLKLLDQIVDALNSIRLTVEFDHEKRLQAIEEFLQDL